MGVPRPIYAITLCLCASLMIVAAPADAKRAKFLNNDQLTLLFSGSEVEGDGGGCGFGGEKLAEIVLKFEDSNNLSIIYECADYFNDFYENGSGTWTVENNELCLHAPSNIQFWKSNALSGENCWKIVRSKWGFAALDSKGNEDWTMTLESHPKHSSREELYAALATVSGEVQIPEARSCG